MHQGKVLTEPLGNGPGRMLAIAQAYTTIDDKLFENTQLEEVHKQAKQTLQNNYVIGPLEQYMLYHKKISYIDLRELFQDAIIVFMPSLSVVDFEEAIKLTEDEFAAKIFPKVPRKVGVDITSIFSEMGTRLKNMLARLDIKEEFAKGDYNFRDRDIFFIPIAPVLSIVEYDGFTLRNIFGENLQINSVQRNIKQEVNDILRMKGKKLMGSTVLEGNYESVFYWYLPSFIDHQTAIRFFRSNEMTITEYKEKVPLYTRYNRILISRMYSRIIDLIPDTTILYPYLCKTSPLFDILKRAGKNSQRSLYEVSIMENETNPGIAEASKSALRKLKQFIVYEQLGSVNSLSFEDI